MNKLSILLAFLVASCGTDYYNNRMYQQPKIKRWAVVAQTQVLVETHTSLKAVASQTNTITYTEPVKGKLVLDGTALSTTDNGNTLDLGSLLINKLTVNKLNVCGVGEDEPCTVAAIRVYSTGTISGFVNNIDGYGAPVTVNGQALPLTEPNALILTSYTLNTDRRVTETDLSDIDYPLVVDMSNSGAGDYEMEIVLEVVLGN